MDGLVPKPTPPAALYSLEGAGLEMSFLVSDLFLPSGSHSRVLAKRFLFVF